MKKLLILPFAAVAAAVLAFSMVENSQAATTEPTTQAPVEFIYGGFSDKAKLSYKIKVNTDKPIKEVDMNLKETDASGKVLLDGIMVWRNIVHAKEQPIEQGKTYEDDTTFPPEVVKVECSLKEVIFQDNTRWSAPASAPVTPGPARVPESPASKTPTTLSSNQAEAESFIKSVYRDMEQNDLGKILVYFDKTVDYYAYGRKDKAFIAEQLRQYFATYPVRSFSVVAGTLQTAPPGAGKMSVTFDVRYSLRDAKGTTSTGRSHVDWDLVKREGAPKIARFTGTSYPDTAAPASP